MLVTAVLYSTSILSTVMSRQMRGSSYSPNVSSGFISATWTNLRSGGRSFPSNRDNATSSSARSVSSISSSRSDRTIVAPGASPPSLVSSHSSRVSSRDPRAAERSSYSSSHMSGYTTSVPRSGTTLSASSRRSRSSSRMYSGSSVDPIDSGAITSRRTRASSYERGSNPWMTAPTSPFRDCPPCYTPDFISFTYAVGPPQPVSVPTATPYDNDYPASSDYSYDSDTTCERSYGHADDSWRRHHRNARSHRRRRSSSIPSRTLSSRTSI